VRRWALTIGAVVLPGLWLPVAAGAPAQYRPFSATRPEAVVVPAVTDTTGRPGGGWARNLATAYGILHAAGLHVSFPRSFAAGSLICAPTIARQAPGAGRHVRRRTVVTLVADRPRCGAESPAVPTPMPSATVPSLIGRRVSAVQAWAARQHLYWRADHLPALRAGRAARLLDNYRVAAQTPGPGIVLSLGVGFSVATPNGSVGGFRPTPLVVTARRIP
jgi:hypothetical protein